MRKRIYFYMDDADLATLEVLVNERYPSFSEFVRLAVAEKVDRLKLSTQVEAIGQDLGHAIEELRQEMAKARADLIADSTQAMQAMRADALASLRKNEEANRALIVALTQVLGGTKPGAPAPRGARNWDAESPMRIPG